MKQQPSAFANTRVAPEHGRDGDPPRPIGEACPKLSWAETAREMAAAEEDWSDWDTTAADGLVAVPWASGPTAEPTAD